ncbi:gp16 family protein [Vibrio splendidus]|jgi:phage gp16-like protein|uniref:gp16 family protein n=1 Tax=Vibrio splendidus TaxID=29497 RepID=UPI000D382512|nr:regulatory protein GemA [Vibrio splendidus]PTP90111.1 regulatory protein GemA [Vibrio splendidus]
MSNRNQLIQLIHVAKRELILDDVTYRLLLANITDKASCSKMGIKELESVLAEMESKGFKRNVNNNKKPFKKRLSPKSGKSKNTIIDKCRAIWITMYQHGFVRDKSETALDKYAQRILKNQENKVDCIAWCNEYQASRVVEALKRWHQRVMIDEIKAKGWTVPMNERTNKLMGYEKVANAFTKMLTELEKPI